MDTLSRSIGVLVLFGATSAGACSLANREGPAVTCSQLGSGTRNACSEGILAACVGTTVQYRVCKDDDVCSAAWQVPGKYRCGEGEAGWGLAGGTPPPDGGVPDTTPVPSGCEAGSPCTVATTGISGGDGDVCGLAVDGANVFFAANGGGVFSAAKAGGASLKIGTVAGPFRCDQLAVDDGFVYIGTGNGVSRLPKAGGAPEPIANSSAFQGLLAFAIDATNVYWLDRSFGGTFDLRRVAKSKGGATVLSTGISRSDTTDVTGRLVVGPSAVFWVEGSSAFRVPKDATAPSAPATVPLGMTALDLGIDPTTIFYANNTSISRVPQVGGGTTPVASGLTAIRMINPAEESVYFVTKDPTYSVRKVGKSGGVMSVVVPGRVAAIRAIVVDDTSVYWTEASNVMRAPR